MKMIKSINKSFLYFRSFDDDLFELRICLGIQSHYVNPLILIKAKTIGNA